MDSLPDLLYRSVYDKNVLVPKDAIGVHGNDIHVNEHHCVRRILWSLLGEGGGEELENQYHRGSGGWPKVTKMGCVSANDGPQRFTVYGTANWVLHFAAMLHNSGKLFGPFRITPVVTVERLLEQRAVWERWLAERQLGPAATYLIAADPRAADRPKM